MREALSYAMRCKTWRAICAIAVLASGAKLGQAQNRQWHPIPVDSDWFNEENWVPTGVPTSDEKALITTSGVYSVTLAEDTTIGSFTLGGQAPEQTLLLDGATLTVAEKSTVLGYGILILDDATVMGPLESRQTTSTIRLQGGTLASLLTNEGTLEAIDSTNTVLTAVQNFNTASGTVHILADTEPATLNFGSGAPRLLVSAGRIELMGLDEQQARMNLSGGHLQNLATGMVQLSGDALLDAGSVANYGRFSGQGRLAGNLANHSQVVVGESVGRLDLDGSFSQSSDAAIEFEIAGATAESEYDVLAAASTADLGGRLIVDFLDEFQPEDSDEFSVIRRSGGQGQFDAVQVSGIPGYGFSIDYEDDLVTMNFRRDGILEGDYNNNGRVEQGDLDLVLLHWGARGRTPLGWLNDLPDNAINQNELDGVLLNWGAQAAPSSFGASGVPEPSSWGLLLFGAAVSLYFGRRQRRHRRTGRFD